MTRLSELVGRLLPGRRGPTVRIRAGAFSAVYAPSLDGDADPGEVVWTFVPYEDDPTEGKDRPVIVLGFEGDRLAVVPLTSKGGDRDELPVGAGAWDSQRRPSYAKVDQVILVAPAAVRREGAVIDRTVFDRVVGAVRRHRSR